MTTTAAISESLGTSRRRQRAVSSAVLMLAVCACGSGTDSSGEVPGAGSASTTGDQETTVAVTADSALAEAAVLAPDDLEGKWRAVEPAGDFPYSAELARTVPACVSFADLVFEGGADHGAAATLTLQREEGLLYSYVVVFPTSEEAAAMLSAVASPEFDDCWSQFMGVAAQAQPMGITDANYVTATPPPMTFAADDYVSKMVTGTIVVDGSESSDSCICVFARVGRAVALIHSAAEHFNTEERVLFTQTGIDKARDVVG